MTTGSILKRVVEINRLTAKQRFEVSEQTAAMLLELQHAKYECVLCKKYRQALLDVLARADVFGVGYAINRNAFFKKGEMRSDDGRASKAIDGNDFDAGKHIEAAMPLCRKRG